MELNNLILDHFNSKQYARKPGRYSASDIYKIKKGELNERNFFELQKLDMKGLKNILRGIALENELTKILTEIGVEQERTESGEQIKLEYKITDEITLVMKPDFVLDNFVLETKCPNKIYDTIPDWYKYQCEVQYRLLNKPVYLTLINIYDNDLPLLCPIEYKPSDKRWEEIKELLINFDKKLR